MRRDHPGGAYPLASAQLRIARPARDLARAEAFWIGGLDLQVLERIKPQAEGEHELVMLGWPGGAWHLELVAGPRGQTPPAPSEEDLLVLTSASPAPIRSGAQNHLFGAARAAPRQAEAGEHIGGSAGVLPDYARHAV